jgi:hypothetical protein
MQFQSNWKLCKKCQVLCHVEDSGGHCWANQEGKGDHDFTDSRTYALLYNNIFPGGDPVGDVAENNWQLCRGCHQLYYTGSNHGNCPSGPGRSHTPALIPNDYVVAGADNGWKWCTQCQAMCYTKNFIGPCPGGDGKGKHVFEATPHHSVARPPVYAIFLTGE